MHNLKEKGKFQPDLGEGIYGPVPPETQAVIEPERCQIFMGKIVRSNQLY
jgi:hypothetical protein